MRKTLAEIAGLIDGEVVGDKDLVVTGFNGLQEAREGDLTFLANPKYLPLFKKTKASAVITSRDSEALGKSIIRTDNPSLAFSHLMAALAGQEDRLFKGIHESAFIAKDAVVGANVAIGPFVVIEHKAAIGENSVIYPGSYIGRGASIGHHCLIYPNVTIREKVVIGNHVIIHSGTVIGSDGFGFVQVEGVHKKIPQVGTVVIEDDVEIGANVAIDRARFGRTVVGRGTKIDNLVHVAHNVVMGEHCIIVAQAGISGSVTIGRGAVLAGQSGIIGHLTIGEGAIVSAQSGVTKSVPARGHVIGFPAATHITMKRIYGHLLKLPEHIKTIKRLEQRIDELERKLAGKNPSRPRCQ